MTQYPVDLHSHPEIKSFFDPQTNTISYVVTDQNSTSRALIDSVMDSDYAAGRITCEHTDEIIAYIEKNKLKLEWLIETYVHADHLSAAMHIQSKLGGKICIGDQITVEQDTFAKVFNEGNEFQRDGSQFDRLLKDGDTYEIGVMKAFAIHTPARMVYVIGNILFMSDICCSSMLIKCWGNRTRARGPVLRVRRHSYDQSDAGRQNEA